MLYIWYMIKRDILLPYWRWHKCQCITQWFVCKYVLCFTEIMLILGTHVARLWRESHNDSRRWIAVVCPVRSWALQKSPECCESPAAAAPAGLWALVLWRGGWTRGIPSGGHSTGAREGSFSTSDVDSSVEHKRRCLAVCSHCSSPLI